MPSIRDRDEGNSRRRERQALLKKGPGTFAYNGGSFDIEHVPTPKLIGKDVPSLDADGLPILDAAGRQVMKPAGIHATDEDGSVIMGGVPKVIKRPLSVFNIRGIDFPKGAPVAVDAPLALKLRGMDCFDEVDESAVQKDKEIEESEPDGPTRSELMRIAAERGFKTKNTTTKAELIAMLSTPESQAQG
jgi:hypothetical protein